MIPCPARSALGQPLPAAGVWVDAKHKLRRQLWLKTRRRDRRWRSVSEKLTGTLTELMPSFSRFGTEYHLHSRCRPCTRWFRSSDEHCASGWTARGVAYRREIGQYVDAGHCRGYSRGTAGDRFHFASAIGHTPACRSVSFCTRLFESSCARRSHRSVSHLDHDPRVHRELAQHAYHLHLHSTLYSHFPSPAQCVGWDFSSS